MKRVPVVATLLVTLAIAAMVALGVWQLVDRRPQKLAFLAAVARNPMLPPVAFPARPDDRLLFRPSSVDCRPPVATRLYGAGNAGFRAIAACRGGVLVQLGTTTDPMATVAWPGGVVRGFLSHAPDDRSLIATAFDRTSKPMMLVADAPPAGLTRNRPPDLAAIPNNHLAYGMQWFFFAGIALVIYLIALRRRLRG